MKTTFCAWDYTVVSISFLVSDKFTSPICRRKQIKDYEKIKSDAGKVFGALMWCEVTAIRCYRTLDFFFFCVLAWHGRLQISWYWFSRWLLVASFSSPMREPLNAIHNLYTIHLDSIYRKRYSWRWYWFSVFQKNKWKSGRLEKKFCNAFKRQWEKFHDKSDAIKLIQMARRWHFQWRRMGCLWRWWRQRRRESVRNEPTEIISFRIHLPQIKQPSKGIVSYTVLNFFFCSFSSQFDLICTENEFTKWLQSSLVIRFEPFAALCKTNSAFGIWTWYRFSLS